MFTRKISVAVAALLLSCLYNVHAIDDNPVNSLFVTNGTVSTVVSNANTVYIGGAFTAVGPFTGSGVPIDSSTGNALATFPRFNGPVNVVIPDGSGGFYVGGSFTSAGTLVRNRIAHILADRTVNPAFNPNANGPISALALSATTLYVGGSFNSIGDEDRNRIAALDRTTGVATAWNPDANSSVNALVIFNGRVYAGGDFTTIGQKTRNRVAAIDIDTGVANTFNPDANGTVSALAVSGSTLFAGGSFTNIGERNRSRIAALDAETGFATPWNPNATSGGTPVVNALAITGNLVYAGGSFNAIGGQTRNNLAAIAIDSGLAAAFNPNPNSTVRTVALSATTVFIGGDFTLIGTDARRSLAAIDPAAASGVGAATTFNANLNASVSALALSGTTLFAGGSFNSVNQQARANLAAIDATTGAPTAFTADVTGGLTSVNALTLAGSVLYVGGTFTTVAAQLRTNIAAVDATSGAIAAFAPACNGLVKGLIASGTTLYACGDFTSLGGQPRFFVGSVDTGTGLATAFVANAGNSVNAIALSGTTLYVGGAFTTLAATARVYFGAVDATTGGLLPLDLAIVSNFSLGVRAIAISAGTVYIGGDFTTLGALTRNRIAAFTEATGAVTAWNPNANSTVLSLLVSGNFVYAGGAFSGIGGQVRSILAELDATTGVASTWNPSPNSSVNALAISSSALYAGGIFTFAGGQSRQGLAAFALSAAAPAITTATPNEIVANGPKFTLILTGTGFTSSSVVMLNNSPRDTSFTVFNPLQISVTILASDIVNIGTGTLTVVTPAPGGGTSNALTVTITDQVLVTNTTDSLFTLKKGSLRRALSVAQTGTTIKFDTTVFATTQFDIDTTIAVLGELPPLDKGNATIDAQDVRVTIKGSGNRAGTNGLRIVSDGNTLRGLTLKNFPRSGILIDGNASAKNNIIGGSRALGNGPNGQGLRLSGNEGTGIEIKGVNADGNVIKGCWIGLDSAGLIGDTNSEGGVVISAGASGNFIGGTGLERNVISGNSNAGITVSGTGADGNTIQGNYIGVAADFNPADRSGSVALPNSIGGVLLQSGTLGNLVGGDPAAGQGNVIAFNSGVGVLVRSQAADNGVLGNQIFSNSNGGIKLDGGNNGVQSPVITSVVIQNATSRGVGERAAKRRAVVSGNSVGDGNVEIFNDESGQGGFILGRVQSSNGRFTLEVEIDPALNLTSTFTDPRGNTSPFGAFTTDTDGDGFSDKLETALGTSPTNPASTPSGTAADVRTLTISKTALKLDFNKPGNDSLSLSGTIPLADGTTITGASALDFGGFIKSIPAGSKEFKVSKPKNGVAKFTLKLAKQTFGDALAEEGFTKTGVNGGKILKAFLFVNNVLFEKDLGLTYTLKNGVGSAK